MIQTLQSSSDNVGKWKAEICAALLTLTFEINSRKAESWASNKGKEFKITFALVETLSFIHEPQIRIMKMRKIKMISRCTQPAPQRTILVFYAQKISSAQLQLIAVAIIIVCTCQRRNDKWVRDARARDCENEKMKMWAFLPFAKSKVPAFQQSSRKSRSMFI